MLLSDPSKFLIHTVQSFIKGEYLPRDAWSLIIYYEKFFIPFFLLSLYSYHHIHSCFSTIEKFFKEEMSSHSFHIRSWLFCLFETKAYSRICLLIKKFLSHWMFDLCFKSMKSAQTKGFRRISKIQLSSRVVRSIVHLGRYFSHLNESKHPKSYIVLTFIPFISLIHDYHQHPSTLIRIIDSYCKNPIYTYSRDVLSFLRIRTRWIHLI